MTLESLGVFGKKKYVEKKLKTKKKEIEKFKYLIVKENNKSFVILHTFTLISKFP